MTISSIERLEYDSLRTILGFLAQVPRTKGIITDADIPVIMRDIRSLACTSRSMHKAINDPEVLDIFFQSLAEKYKQPPESFAVDLNIAGSRKWLWERISQNEYGKTYAAIQSIYALALDVKEEAKRAGLASDDFDVVKEKPYPFNCQTKTGFMLYFDGSVPSIVTPLGEVRLYTGTIPNSPLSLLELFIKCLGATFAGISHVYPNNPLGPNENYIVPISDLNDLQIRRIEDSEKTDIAENELQNEKGKQNLIATREYEGHSTYEIRRIGNQVAPRVTLHPEMPSFRLDLIPAIWEMFEKNRCGIDPTADAKNRPLARPNIPEVFPTLPEACEDFFSFVRQLDAQPFEEDGSKVLDIGTNLSMGFALTSLNSAAKQFLSVDTHWDIQVLLDPEILRKAPSDSEPCSLEALKIAYTQVLSEIGANWKRSSLKDYPNISQAKSEETHQLFVRQPRLSGEAGVISLVAESLGILFNKYLAASDDWKSEPAASLPPRPRPIYLWIKKDKLELVSRLINLREIS